MESQILAEISRPDLITLRTSSTLSTDAKITDCQHLASYNWLDKSHPTILVPGSPPLWSQPSVPKKLAPDSGMVTIDQNAVRNPTYPLEPLFHAMFALNPDFDIKDVDLVTDRNNIRKLLRFVTGSSPDSFQIRVEVVGNKTALFTRVEKRAKELIQGFRGYGHSFEKAYTKNAEESTGHHRIISYRFGKMSCIVRHETDGYISNPHESTSRTAAKVVTESLSEMLGKVSITESEDVTTDLAGIKVISGGRQVDISSTIEIKTRAISRTLDMTETIPQLWISQTPTLVVAYHSKGVFNKVDIRKMNQEIVSWERANQSSLHLLAILIKKIIEVVKKSEENRGLVIYDGGVTLRIVADEGKQTLPDHLYAMCKLKKAGEVPESGQANSKGTVGVADKPSN